MVPQMTDMKIAHAPDGRALVCGRCFVYLYLDGEEEAFCVHCGRRMYLDEGEWHGLIPAKNYPRAKNLPERK